MFGRTTRKLTLRKETLRALSDAQLQTVVGGGAVLAACGTHHCTPKFTDNCPTFHNCPSDACPAWTILR